VLDWLDESNQALAAPYLLPEDDDSELDDFYPPGRSLNELRELYAEMQERKGSKREVLDRILEGDWRHGVSLYQLAMADLQHLYDHPTSQKWTAYRVVPLETPKTGDEEVKVDKASLSVPRFHPPTFLANLHNLLPPDVKAHLNLDRHKTLPLVILRVLVLDSPYGTSAVTRAGALEDAAARTLFVAFPDAAPSVFVSRATAAGSAAGEAGSLLRVLVDAVPKALSRPRARVALKPTASTARNLEALLERRGAGRTAGAAGGWMVYADERKNRGRESPLDTVVATKELAKKDGQQTVPSRDGDRRKRPRDVDAEKEERAVKRRKAVAQARFGNSAIMGDGKGVERLDIRIEDPFTYPEGSQADATQGEEPNREESAGGRSVKGSRKSGIDIAFEREAETIEDDRHGETTGDESSFRPDIRLTFHGSHVFAGIRQLVEAGIIDGERMPGWMTGEDGVTIGVVRNGRIRGHKGSGT
jgi:central kinetochore subunit Mis15/CHL4